jgi:hypothetical protein
MDPNIEAAQWIRAHSAPNAVVMARWEALVYHYSERRVIWFPASSDTAVLMAGIRRYHIRFIVPTEGDGDAYWMPSDRRCFGALLRAWPEMFHQIHRGPHEEIYEYSGPPRLNDGNIIISRRMSQGSSGNSHYTAPSGRGSEARCRAATEAVRPEWHNCFSTTP